MESDALSESLMRMRLKTSSAGIMDSAGRWATLYPPFEAFKLQVVVKGDRYFVSEGKKVIQVKAGDCILVTGKKPITVGSDLSVKKKLDIKELLASKKDGVMTVNGGGELLSITTYFNFEGHLPKVLFDGLPGVIHVAGDSDQAAILRWSLERFKTEYMSENPGRQLFLNHITPIMLMQILRIYLASPKNEDQNWLLAVTDPKLTKVFEAMHSQYKKNWSLESLAKLAGLSRSGFALAFRKKAGISPLDYLTKWRMQIACDLLRTEGSTVASVAEAVGYDSESAFSVAFKRELECRPGQCQRDFR